MPIPDDLAIYGGNAKVGSTVGGYLEPIQPRFTVIDGVELTRTRPAVSRAREEVPDKMMNRGDFLKSAAALAVVGYGWNDGVAETEPPRGAKWKRRQRSLTCLCLV